MNKLFFVQILSHCPDGNAVIRKHVMARTAKAAILAVIESVGEVDPAFNWPGWELLAYEASQPYILK